MATAPGHDEARPIAATIRRARKLLAERSSQEVAAEIGRIVELNPRPLELAGPVAQTALSLLARAEQEPAAGKWHTAGRKAELAVHARLIDADLPPAAIRAVGADVAASWGELRLFLNGRNITANRREGRKHNAVRWFLLPLLEWLVRSWFQLLGPPLNADDAQRALEPPPTGFPAPRLEVTRWVHRAEVSAEPRMLRIPAMTFEVGADAVALDPSHTAQILRQWCVALASEVHERAGSTRTEALINQAKNLDTFTTKLDQQVRAAPLQVAVQEVRQRVGDRFDSLLKPVRHRPSPLRLAFGSATPRITTADVDTIWDAVNEAERARAPVEGLLRAARRSAPLPAGELPWKHGQALAYEAFDALDVARNVFVDVERIIADLGVPLRVAALDDTSVRGLVVGYPTATPVVLVNRACTRNRKRPGRRFTLAHELCHVLFDQGASRSIGVVDGEWAPYGLEQRANAFAAMFLMPPELVESVVKELAHEFSIARLASVLGTSSAATREHIRNLRTIGALDVQAPELQMLIGKESDPEYDAAGTWGPDFRVA